MKCVNCGNDIPDKAKFCPYCGTQNEPQQEAAESEQTTEQYQQQWEEPSQKTTVSLDCSLILKIGTGILALIYVIFAVRYLVGGVRSLLSVFSWGYAISIPGAILTLINGVCFGGMAAILVLIGFSKQREKVKSLFTVLGILGVAVIGLSFLRMIWVLIMGGGFAFAVKILFNPLIGTAAALAATYGLLYIAKEAPTIQDYQNVDSMSDVFKNCADAVQGAAKDVASDVNSKADAYHSSNTSYSSYSQETGYQGQENKNYSENYAGGNMNQNYPNATPLKTDRGLLGYILLTFITCGIYSYYFIYSVARDVNTACEGDGKSTGGLLKFILLSIITCGIYSWVWQYSLGNRLAANAPRYGMSFQENGTTVLLWDLFGILLCGIGPFIAMNIIIKNTNSICMAYNRSKGFM